MYLRRPAAHESVHFHFGRRMLTWTGMIERVFVYTTPVCAYCIRAKALLKHKGIPFREVDVGADPELRRWMVEASGRRTVPARPTAADAAS